MVQVSRPSISPSRALDFERCPLLYRLRVVDKRPEPPSRAAAKGTVVHAVLEHLFALPAAGRTREAALADLEPSLAALRDREANWAQLFEDPDAVATFLDEASALVSTYFEVEDPTRLSPKAQEYSVSAELEGGLRLRGIIDRLDEAPATGALRVVDYKTGKAPAPQYQGSVLFQVRCYALVLWRSTKQLPAVMQVIYLADGQILHTTPSIDDVRATENQLGKVWRDIESSARSGQWQAKRGPLCSWCAHQDICPAFGGATPPQPADTLSRLGIA